MNKTFTRNLLLLAVSLFALPSAAQLSSNPNKFLGNITTSYNVDAGGGVPKYYTLWNQITCENESKWSSAMRRIFFCPILKYSEASFIVSRNLSFTGMLSFIMGPPFPRKLTLRRCPIYHSEGPGSQLLFAR